MMTKDITGMAVAGWFVLVGMFFLLTCATIKGQNDRDARLGKMPCGSDSECEEIYGFSVEESVR